MNTRMTRMPGHDDVLTAFDSVGGQVVQVMALKCELEKRGFDVFAGAAAIENALTDGVLGKTAAGGLFKKTKGLRKNDMPKQSWIEHAYPLQQITIQLQGTRHSSREAVLAQLDDITARLRGGDLAGEESDDDFGYKFEVKPAANGPSLFGDDPCTKR